MWTMIAAVVKLIALLLGEKLTRDKDRKELKKEICKEVTAAIKKRDKSEITKAFARMKRK